MLASTYSHTRIGYEIKKFAYKIFAILEDLHLHQSMSDLLPDNTSDILDYLRVLKPLTRYDSFEQIVREFKLIYRNVDAFLNDLTALDNPYFYAKRVYTLLLSVSKWVRLNNLPCSEISPLSRLFLEKCV